jgi:hypothetical protein
MRNLMQEKFQKTFPDKKTGDQDWVSDASARKMKSAPADLNCLPPGTNIESQDFSDTTHATHTMSGETDASRDWNRQSVKNGYKRLPMNPTDDAYTDEHVSPFYRPAIVNGDEGFVERNNMLDRE